MSSPTESQVVPQPQLLEALTLLTASTDFLMTATLHLYQNAQTLTPQTVLGDFVEATYVGYAAVAGLTWSDPYYDVNGTALVLGGANVIICTGDATPNVIYGYYLTNAAGTLLMASYAFSQGVAVSLPGDAVEVTVFFRYSGT